MQKTHSDCSRVAQHALFLGPGGQVQPDPFVPAQPAKSVDSSIQPDPSEESVKPESFFLYFFILYSNTLNIHCEQNSYLIVDAGKVKIRHIIKN